MKRVHPRRMRSLLYLNAPFEDLSRKYLHYKILRLKVSLRKNEK